MTDKPAAFQATLVACRQVRDEVHFILSVPSEKGTEYLDRIGGFPKPGESRWCGVARINPTAKEDQPQELHKTSPRQSLEKEPARPHNPYSRRAGILCSNSDYHNFIGAPGIEDRASFAASYLRHICGVASRKEILPGTQAAILFEKEEASFKVWLHGPKHGAA